MFLMSSFLCSSVMGIITIIAYCLGGGLFFVVLGGMGILSLILLSTIFISNKVEQSTLEKLKQRIDWEERCNG